MGFKHTRTYKGRTGTINLDGVVEVVTVSYSHRHVPTQNVSVRFDPACEPKWLSVRNPTTRKLPPTHNQFKLLDCFGRFFKVGSVKREGFVGRRGILGWGWDHLRGEEGSIPSGAKKTVERDFDRTPLPWLLHGYDGG